MEKILRDEIGSILGAANYMTLATVRPDGFPQATTVSFANDGLTIFFGCREQSQKAANLARNHKVSLTINVPFTSWDQIRGLSIGGLAHRITDNGQAKRVSKLLLERSPETIDFANYGLVGVVFFKIAPKVITVLDYRTGIGHSTLVPVNSDDR